MSKSVMKVDHSTTLVINIFLRDKNFEIIKWNTPVALIAKVQTFFSGSSMAIWKHGYMYNECFI